VGLTQTMFVLHGRRQHCTLCWVFLGRCQSVGGMRWSGGGSDGPMNPYTTVGQPPVCFSVMSPQQVLPAGGGSFIVVCACMCWSCRLAAAGATEERERHILFVHATCRHVCAGLAVRRATYVQGMQEPLCVPHLCGYCIRCQCVWTGYSRAVCVCDA
jgi:hypothetical protein